MLRSRLTILAVSGLVAVGCGGTREAGPQTSAAQVVAEPERYFGEEVAIDSAVSNPIDPRVWEVAEGRLFVITIEDSIAASMKANGFA